MQIANVTAGYSDPATVGKRGDAIEALAGRALKTADLRTPSTAGGRSAAGAILARYDVTRISPTEFSEMIQKLRQADAVSESEFQELAAIRLDLESAGVKPDESVNLMDFYARKVKELQGKFENADAAAARQQLGPVLRRLDWVQKFATIQSNPGAVGLDARV